MPIHIPGYFRFFNMMKFCDFDAKTRTYEHRDTAAAQVKRMRSTSPLYQNMCVAPQPLKISGLSYAFSSSNLPKTVIIPSPNGTVEYGGKNHSTFHDILDYVISQTSHSPTFRMFINKQMI